MRAIALTASLVGLVACSSGPPPVKAVVPPTYAELMASADAARKKGGVVEAMGFYEKAAKADPSKKEPWARIAQIQFDAHNYGSAINAAEEVLQRDTADVTAKSILAVSGLRVSADALGQLRDANALGGSAREEAQTLARVLHETLGESIFPAPAAPLVVTPEKTLAHTASARHTPPPAPQQPAQAPPEPKRNPFDALK